MGIKNLLTIIDVVQELSLEHYRGKRLGVDGYAWIHKCKYQQGHNLVVQNDKSGYLAKIKNRFDMLLAYDIKIVLVLDGDKLPSKNNTENLREDRRAEMRLEANKLLQEGDMLEAEKKLSASYEVTPQLAFETLQYLKKAYGPNKIECRIGLNRHRCTLRGRLPAGLSLQDELHRRRDY